MDIEKKTFTKSVKISSITMLILRNLKVVDTDSSEYPSFNSYLTSLINKDINNRSDNLVNKILKNG